jgi:hypothetical protein
MNINQNFPPPTIAAECACCFPPQTLVRTGQRAYCPLTERIYEDANNREGRQAQVTTIYGGDGAAATDFYPGRPKRRGEVAPFAINPAEDRFGA